MGSETEILIVRAAVEQPDKIDLSAAQCFEAEPGIVDAAQTAVRDEQCFGLRTDDQVDHVGCGIDGYEQTAGTLYQTDIAVGFHPDKCIVDLRIIKGLSAAGNKRSRRKRIAYRNDIVEFKRCGFRIEPLECFKQQGTVRNVIVDNTGFDRLDHADTMTLLRKTLHQLYSRIGFSDIGIGGGDKNSFGQINLIWDII